MDIKRRGMIVGLGGITAASIAGLANSLPAEADPRYGHGGGPSGPSHSGHPPGHIVNVRDYGARGDGSGDDYPAFQAMADDRRQPDGRHRIVIPPGDYRLSHPIIAKHPLAVTGLAADGSNYGQSSVRLQATATMDALIIPEGWHRNTGNGPKIATSNVQLDGGGKAKHGIILTASGEMHFNTRVTSTTSHGWFLPEYTRDGSTRLKSTHGCRFIFCGSGRTGGCGFFTEDLREDSELVGFAAVRVGGEWGISIQRGTGWLIDGCHPTQFQKGGIFVDRVWETRIVNNYVDTLGAAEDFHGTCVGIWAQGRGPVNLMSNVVNQKPSKVPTNKTIGYRIGGVTDGDVVKANLVNNTGLHHSGSDWKLIDAGNSRFSLTSAIAHNLDAATGGAAGAGLDDIREGRTRRGYASIQVGSDGRFRIDHHLGVEPAYADVKTDAEHAAILVHVSHDGTNDTYIEATARRSDGEPFDGQAIHVYWTAVS